MVGDPLDCITDPTVQDTSSVANALSVLREWDLLDRVPRSVRDYLAGCAEAESPQVSGLEIESVLLARGEDGTEAVLQAAQARGFAGARLAGRWRARPRRLAASWPRWRPNPGARGFPWARGTVIVACGGEYTVNLGPDADGLLGRGGPSQEAAAWAALALEGVEGIAALFADTDGSDAGPRSRADWWMDRWPGRPAGWD